FSLQLRGRFRPIKPWPQGSFSSQPTGRLAAIPRNLGAGFRCVALLATLHLPQVGDLGEALLAMTTFYTHLKGNLRQLMMLSNSREEVRRRTESGLVIRTW